MNPLVFFLTVTATTLVLQSGDRLPVDGTVREENGVVTFRSNGTLYSLPAAEVNLTATAAGAAPAPAPPKVTVLSPQEPVKPLRVSEESRKRLLEELSKNHSGSAPSAEQVKSAPPVPAEVSPAQQTADEWSWRRQARDHEEAIRRAQEELDLLRQTADDLRFKIQSLVSLGYKPAQFTYDTTRLQQTLEEIPYAELNVKRAEREYEQFRDDARRQGIMPGWLR